MSAIASSPGLDARTVHIWLSRPDDVTARDPTLFDRYRALLDDHERARFERLKLPRLHQPYLLARALVRCTLSRYMTLEPADWRFVSNDHGKPSIRDPDGRLPPLQFNLSHTDGLLACAVTLDGPIGVDVETVGRRTDVDAVGERFFAEREWRELMELPDAAERRTRFFDLWTLKEAYIKARGLGLAIPLRGFAFSWREPDGGIELTLGDPARYGDHVRDDPRRWYFRLLDAGEPHRLALCAARAADGSPPRIQVRETVPLAAEETR